MGDNEIILVTSHVVEPSQLLPQMLREALEETMGRPLDLTGFDNSAQNSIMINIQGMDRTTTMKLGHDTSLQLAFGSFADLVDKEPSVIIYVCNGRRVSHDSEETASQIGLTSDSEHNMIYALEKRLQHGIHQTPETGKMIVYLQEVGSDNKEFFRVDVQRPLDRLVSESCIIMMLHCL